jgi:hypothetical protein
MPEHDNEKVHVPSFVFGVACVALVLVYAHVTSVDLIIAKIIGIDLAPQVQSPKIECLNGGSVSINNTCECLPHYGGRQCQFQRLHRSTALMYHTLFFPIGGALLYLGHTPYAIIQAIVFFSTMILWVAYFFAPTVKTKTEPEGKQIHNDVILILTFLLSVCVVFGYIFGFCYFAADPYVRDSNGLVLLA